MKWLLNEDLQLKELAPIMNVIELHKIFKYRTINSIRERIRKFKLKYQNVNSQFFERQDAVSNYILGYWLADGYISNRSGGKYFSIASIDLEHLESIKNIMQIKTNFISNNNCNIMVVGNKKLVDNIIKLGGKYRKTKIIKINDIKFNKKYFYDFLRGYFDGDGSVIKQKKNNKIYFGGICFTGSENIIKSLYKILRVNYKCTLYSNKKDCWYIGIYGESAKLLLNKFYNNKPKLFLSRKFLLYEKLVLNKDFSC